MVLRLEMLLLNDRKSHDSRIYKKLRFETYKRIGPKKNFKLAPRIWMAELTWVALSGDRRTSPEETENGI